VGILSLNVIDIHKTLAPGALNYLLENNLRDELFFFKRNLIHTGLNPYLSQLPAGIWAMMALGIQKIGWRFWNRWYQQRASPTYTWLKLAIPTCSADVWAIAIVVGQQLNFKPVPMRVAGADGNLQLAEGAPGKWFRTGLI
jgi:hypothetical protein